MAFQRDFEEKGRKGRFGLRSPPGAPLAVVDFATWQAGNDRDLEPGPRSRSRGTGTTAFPLGHEQFSFTRRSWKDGDRHYPLHPSSDVTQYVNHLRYQSFFTVSACPGVVFADCRDDE